MLSILTEMELRSLVIFVKRSFAAVCVLSFQSIMTRYDMLNECGRCGNGKTVVIGRVIVECAKIVCTPTKMESRMHKMEQILAIAVDCITH